MCLAIARLYPDGTYDQSFVLRGVECFLGGVVVDEAGPQLVVQANGKILMSRNIGEFGLADGKTTRLARLNSDGSVDSTLPRHDALPGKQKPS